LQKGWCATDPIGLYTAYLNNSLAVAGKGHNAFMVGNDYTGWHYYSYGGDISGSIDNSSSGGSLQSGNNGTINEQTFTTLQEAQDYLAYNGYTSYQLFNTTPQQENVAQITALLDFADSPYNLFDNNCDSMALDALKAEGIVIEDFDKSLAPNTTFNNIQQLTNSSVYQVGEYPGTYNYCPIQVR
jgi:hypothetical protein